MNEKSLYLYGILITPNRFWIMFVSLLGFSKFYVKSTPIPLTFDIFSYVLKPRLYF